MATNFPSSLDNFTNPVSGNTLDSPSHSLQHSDANDAIEAIEAKLGVGNSPAGSATAGDVLTISAAGTSAWTTPTTSGLVMVVPTSVAVGSGSGSVSASGAVTFSGASSVSLNGVFSSTYDNYRILVKGSAGSTITFRMRATTTDDSGTNYNIQQGFYARSTTSSCTRVTSATSANIGYLDASQSNMSIDMFSPFLAEYTTYNSLNFWADSTASATTFFGAHHQNTSYNGITFLGAANMTGTIRVYGYKN